MRTARGFVVAFGVVGGLGVSAAQSQTVVNLTNLDPSVASGFSNVGSSPLSAGTSLDLLNTTTALSNGGLFGGAVTNQTQQASNQLNTIGLTSLGAAAPVVLGDQTPITVTPSVTINTIASAYNAVGGSGGAIDAGTSTTINNTNAAISSGVNQIVGAPSALNGLWSGGYGPTSGNVQVGGSQIGINTVNGVGAAFAAGTAVTLSQLPGAPSPGGSGGGAPIGTSPIIQGGALNMSTVNTLLAYTAAGAAAVNGSAGQQASNSFNTATLQGSGLSLSLKQATDGFSQGQTAFQAVNRALAYSAGAASAAIDPSVSNLAQSASNSVNALSLLSGNVRNAGVTLSGGQSTGFDTTTPGATSAVAGSTATVITSNQVTASTIDAGGFMPYEGQTNDVGSPWSGFASTVAPGLPAPGSYTNNSFVNAIAYVNPNTSPPSGLAGPIPTSAGTASITAVIQSIAQTSNTVGVGTAAAPLDTTTGPAGFLQRTGTIGLAVFGSPGFGAGLNGAIASTGIGPASVTTLNQSFATQNNIFNSSGRVNGALSQSADAIDFSATQIVSPVTASNLAGATIVAPNGGSGIAEGVPMTNTGGVTNGVAGGAMSANHGPYVGIAAAGAQPPIFNNAQAVTSFGASGLTGVAQAATSMVNGVMANGAVDSGAAGTIAQSLGVLADYGMPTASMNTQAATSQLAGNAAVANAKQSLALGVNTIASGGAVDGSIAQAGPSSPSSPLGATSGSPTNYIGAGSFSGFGQGTAQLSGVVQSNAIGINMISAGASLGSSTSPAAFSQTSGQAGKGFALGSSSGSPNPSNVAYVISNDGAGGSATGADIGQGAQLAINSIAGGAAGGGLSGAVTQTSYGMQTSLGNQAVAYAASAPVGQSGSLAAMPISAVSGSGLGVQGTMSGNSTLTNVVQVADQSLNAMILPGGAKGILNQATAGATAQTTSNQTFAQANLGYAATSGSQVVASHVNTVAAK